MNTEKLTETEVRTRLITPAIHRAGWDPDRVREEFQFTDGRVIVRGQMTARGKPSRADYVLEHKKNIRLAVVEAKDNAHAIADGMQQALRYAAALDVPFAFSSNGDGFIMHDRTGAGGEVEKQITLDEFPSPQELWQRYAAWKGLNSDEETETFLEDYFDDGGGKTPRYYQSNAINAATAAIARGQNRILLVMATGTGKTFTAFQIIHRLWKAGKKQRILFLADRNILVDQTMVNDFRPFGGAMAKLSTSSKTIERDDGERVELKIAVDRKRRIDTSYEIYLGLYQSLTGPEDRQKLFRELSPDFFDLIVIDECHRGSAAEDSAWREILDYFSDATQIGMTATPRETKYASNIDYFGEPVYSYTLKQGIEDGFLAPYKVIKVHIDRDIEGYRPEAGQRDRDGEEVEDRIYNTQDFDRTLVLDERTKLVAAKITQFLKETDRNSKTIVFCVDEEHAARMRQALINENADRIAANDKYVMRITGSDTEGKQQLDNFIDPESTYPVVVTTSRLLSTGVDAKTCRLIVLDREVGSMTEFKQIVGRGTRIHEDSGKRFFTLMDFRGATAHFADPDFDGDPVQIYTPGADDPLEPPIETDGVEEPDEPFVHDPPDGDGDVHIPEPGSVPRRKVYVDEVPVMILAERVEYLDSDGKLITESLKDFTRRRLRKNFASLDDFLRRWNETDRKSVIVEELEEEGVLLDALQEAGNRDLDPFDLICHVAFDRPPLTRRERADNVKKRDVFSRYGEEARAVLNALLEKYADDGVLDVDDVKVLSLQPFNEMGTRIELVRHFGGKDGFLKAANDLQAALYSEAEA